MKRTTVEEHKIITTELHEYLDLERHFNACLIKPPGSYYPNLVHDFCTNYLEILENDCLKRSKVEDIRNRIRFLVRGVTIDISDHTINQILFNQ